MSMPSRVTAISIPALPGSCARSAFGSHAFTLVPLVAVTTKPIPSRRIDRPSREYAFAGAKAYQPFRFVPPNDQPNRTDQHRGETEEQDHLPDHHILARSRHDKCRHKPGQRKQENNRCPISRTNEVKHEMGQSLTINTAPNSRIGLRSALPIPPPPPVALQPLERPVLLWVPGGARGLSTTRTTVPARR